MNLTTSTNSQIFGKVKCPGDKSISQRALMIGALMNQEMTVDGFLHAEDPLSTMSALNQIGAGITVDKKEVELTESISHVGKYFVEIKLGHGFSGRVKIKVSAEE